MYDNLKLNFGVIYDELLKYDISFNREALANMIFYTN